MFFCLGKRSNKKIASDLCFHGIWICAQTLIIGNIVLVFKTELDSLAATVESATQFGTIPKKGDFMKAWIGFIIFGLVSTASASDVHHKPVKVSPEFENMKALVGTWEGKSKMEGKDVDIKVTYALTSNGTTLVETLGPGTPGEMVTIYANNGKKVNATHYCAIGNQPQMALKSSKKNSFTFEMEGTNGINDKNESHMHGVTLTLDGNKLKQVWSNYKDGKPGDTVSFELTKKI